MNKYQFSYENYRKLLIDIKETAKLSDFAYVINHNPEEFILLRHDVEFSPLRALKMAKIENEYEKYLKN